MKSRTGKFRYIDLADQIQSRIEKGAYKLSEKLPSLRVLCQQTGYSMTTVFQAYIELEKRGIVESRQRSGYFIRPRLRKLRQTPGMAYHDMVARKITLDDLVHQLTEDMGNPEVLKLGAVAVSPDHLPCRQIYKHFKSIPQDRIPDMIAGYVHPQGDAQLRRQISNLLFTIMPEVSEEDIVITNGCTDALSLGLRAVARPGDTVIVESPADPWLRQTIKDYDMYALEVPADPETGIDLDRVEHILEQETVAACLVNPNCQNPLGFIMPDDHKKRLLSITEKKGVPILENDVSGDLYFESQRPVPIKRWDVNHRVLYCGSVSKILAPGLRIGWVVPGQFKEAVCRLKLNRSMISPTLSQAVLANYFKEGTFNRHLRRLRKLIKLQYGYCAAALNRYLPRTVRMTSPSGGLTIWIELPEGLKGSDVYYKVRQKGISILPGFLCARSGIYDRFIRIGYGGRWDKQMENAIKIIGDTIKEMENRPGGETC